MKRTPIASAAILAACALCASDAWSYQQPSFAQHDGLELASGAQARQHRLTTTQVPRAMTRAWRTFRADFAGSWVASWDQATGVPSRIFGTGIDVPKANAQPKTAQRFAHQFLQRHIELLAPGASVSDFVLISNVEHDGLRTVAFYQHAQGLRVLGGQLSFRFKNDRLMVIASEALPHVSAHQSAKNVTKSVAFARAQDWVAKDMGAATTAAELDGNFILPIVSAGRVDRYRVVKRVTVSTASPISRWTVYVDASDGMPIAKEQTLRFATGNVRYNTPVRRPGSTRNDYPAQLATLLVDGQPATTDVNGLLTFPDQQVQLTMLLDGPRVTVKNKAGADAQLTVALDPNGTVVWNDEGDQFVDAQLTGFIHAQIAKDHGKILAPDMNWIDNSLPVNVNVDDPEGQQCNAFYDPNSVNINFFKSSGNCENTGRLPDVIYHEFGHGFHHHAVILGSGDMGDGSLGEGVSDYYAASITGDPGMGRGFFYSNAPLRHIDPTTVEKSWPDDIAGDIHATGLIIAGALWDLRKLLQTKHGEQAGADLTDQLFYGAIKNAVDIPTMYVETLAADDDDGNLENGTPNACEIVEAYGAHGLRTLNVDSTALGVEPPQMDGHDVSIKIEGLFQQCPGDTVAGAELNWKLRSGDAASIETIAMAGGPLEFSGSIPEVADGAVVNYGVALELDVGATMSFPDNPADDMYEFFVGEVTPIYCTDFEADPELEGWTHGLISGQMSEGADDWQWGSPAGMGGDPAAAFSGTKIYGNDLGHGNFNGTYQRDKVNFADSPVIDVSAFPGANIRLQYRRWLQVEDGFFDAGTIYANGTKVWDNVRSKSSNDADLDHQDWEWRFHDVDLTDAVTDGNVQVRFEISSDGGKQFGGWSIDDFCVVATQGEPPIDSICGNNTIEPGEQCDDGNGDDGDGCSATCQTEDGTNGNEEPDDSFVVDGGCGCHVVGSEERQNDSTPWQLSVLALGLLGLLRRRR